MSRKVRIDPAQPSGRSLDSYEQLAAGFPPSRTGTARTHADL
jgi:hypothetical protein